MSKESNQVQNQMDRPQAGDSEQDPTHGFKIQQYIEIALQQLIQNNQKIG